jgi:hypothetical protein
VLQRRLQPRCIIGYDRVAHVGMTTSGPCRLTMDRNVHCALSNGFDFDGPGTGLLLFAGDVILEFKYRESLPSLFKMLVEDMALAPAAVSKYRTGIQAWGLATTTKVG